jgi:cbb3-type cytochrome oxidase maturation protein
MKIFKPKTEFSKNVLTLMTGTTLAQAIPLAITPILTRIYTPEDFGLYSLFIAVVTILSVIATGRYEFAILLPRNEKDAKIILVISCTITTLISLILLLLVLIFNDLFTKLLGNPKISVWLYFIPVAVFLNGIYQSFMYWSNRKRQYKILANNRILQSGTIASTNLGIGISGLSSIGLIFGQIIGQLVATFYLVAKIIKKDNIVFDNINKLHLFAFLKRYSKFPKIDVPASLFNISSHQLIHLFFNTIFNATIAGYFYLTQRILGIPVSILSSAVLAVFQEQAAKDFKKTGNAKEIFLNTFKKLFMLSFIPSIFFLFLCR